MKKRTVPVTCPHCGHVQQEPASAYSTSCKGCKQHYRVQEVLHPTAAAARHTIEKRRVTCLQCARELTVSAAAQSTICQHCGGYVDLSDYRITGSVGKNYRTRGRVVIEPGGFLFNTDTVAGEVVLKGRVLGKLRVDGALEIHERGEIKGTFVARKLVIPASQSFTWPEPIVLESADILGELAANLRVSGQVRLRSTARYFGRLEAPTVVVESGAVVVGDLAIGPSAGK